MAKEKESAKEDKGENEMTESKTTKKTGTTNGKSNKLGMGGRAQQLKNKGMSGALIGYIGRSLYGKKKMANWSSKGRKRASK